MATWIMRMMSGGGYAALVLLTLLENVFPPIPSELILPLAGYMVRKQELHFAGVVLAGTLGSVLGAIPLYMAGRKLGLRRIERAAGRHERWTTISAEDVARAEQWFARHGIKAVILCRLVPGVRSLISIPAGVRRMSMVTFLACTAAGSMVWCAILAGAGYALGTGYKTIDRYLDPVSWVIVAALVFWYAFRVIRGRS
ncbi:MAG TPA: DedA family protein [Thermoanaerobaculia bacterium]|nr:DedA family protein [Thermoanaerobaculia bacterium]